LAVLLLLLSVLLVLAVLLLTVLVLGRVGTGLGLVHALHVVDGRTAQRLNRVDGAVNDIVATVPSIASATGRVTTIWDQF